MSEVFRIPSDALSKHEVGGILPVLRFQPADPPLIAVDLVAVDETAWRRELAKPRASHAPVSLTSLWSVGASHSDDEATLFFRLAPERVSVVMPRCRLALGAWRACR